MSWCALLTAVKNYNKSRENCETFSSWPRPRPRTRLHIWSKTKTHCCPGGASTTPRPWSVSRTTPLSWRRLDYTKTLVCLEDYTTHCNDLIMYKLHVAITGQCRTTFCNFYNCVAYALLIKPHGCQNSINMIWFDLIWNRSAWLWLHRLSNTGRWQLSETAMSPALSTLVQLVSTCVMWGHLLAAWSTNESPVSWPWLHLDTFSSFT